MCLHDSQLIRAESYGTVLFFQMNAFGYEHVCAAHVVFCHAVESGPDSFRGRVLVFLRLLFRPGQWTKARFCAVRT